MYFLLSNSISAPLTPSYTYETITPSQANIPANVLETQQKNEEEAERGSAVLSLWDVWLVSLPTETK